MVPSVPEPHTIRFRFRALFVAYRSRAAVERCRAVLFSRACVCALVRQRDLSCKCCASVGDCCCVELAISMFHQLEAAHRVAGNDQQHSNGYSVLVPRCIITPHTFLRPRCLAGHWSAEVYCIVPAQRPACTAKPLLVVKIRRTHASRTYIK